MRKISLLITIVMMLSLLAACSGASSPSGAATGASTSSTSTPASGPTAPAAATIPAGTSAPAAAGATATTGSVPQTGNQSGAMQLNFWGGWTGPDGGVMQKMVDEYNTSQSKVHVTLMTQQWTPLFDKFVLSVKSKTVPDVLAMHGPDIPQFAAQGVLEPLDSVVSGAGFKASDFSKAAWDGTMYSGKQYAFPLDLHMHAIYYNADLLSKAGVTAPTGEISGDQFIKLATALTVDKNGKHPGDSGFDANNVQQYGLAMYNNHHGFYDFYALLAQQGDTFLNNGSTQINFNPADGVKAWQWLQDLRFKYHVVPAGETNPLQDFLSGKTAMLEDGPWQIPAMQNKAGLKWGSFPDPQVFAKPATWGSGHVLTIPVQADKAREAAAEQFVTWVVQHSDEWGTSGNIPALNTARQSTKFTSLPGREGFVASLPYEVMLPAIPAEAQVFSAAATSPIVVVAQDILVQDKPVSAAMQAMITAINSLLASAAP